MERASSLQITNEEMLVAQQMAGEFMKRDADLNEAHKVLRFLVTEGDGSRMFTFLETMQRNGSVVVRSQQTLGYYTTIQQICERHLRKYQGDAAKMMRILGWAIRLTPFYRLEPHLTGPNVPAEDEEKPTQLGDLKPGQELEGRVVKLERYGAFVDVGGGLQGLVHVSKLRGGYVHNAADVVRIGDRVMVWVEQVEMAGKRLSLTMINPWGDEGGKAEPPVAPPKPAKERPPRLPAIRVNSMEEVIAGVWVMGKVTRVESNRVLVDIGLGEPASIAFGQLEGQPNDPDEVAEVLPAGMAVEARVVNVNKKGRVQLTLKE